MDQAEQNDAPEEALKLYSRAVDELRKCGIEPKVKSEFDEWELAAAKEGGGEADEFDEREDDSPDEGTRKESGSGNEEEKKEEGERERKKEKKKVMTPEERLSELLINALGGRASVHGHLDHFDRAIEDLTEALRFDSYHIETLIRRGEIHLRMRNHKEAAKDFNRVREVQPDHVDAVYYLSLMLHAHFKKNY